MKLTPDRTEVSPSYHLGVYSQLKYHIFYSVHPVTSGRSSGLAIVNVSYFYQNLAPLREF
jgi:hypothetical protein